MPPCDTPFGGWKKRVCGRALREAPNGARAAKAPPETTRAPGTSQACPARGCAWLRRSGRGARAQLRGGAHHGPRGLRPFQAVLCDAKRRAAAQEHPVPDEDLVRSLSQRVRAAWGALEEPCRACVCSRPAPPPAPATRRKTNCCLVLTPLVFSVVLGGAHAARCVARALAAWAPLGHHSRHLPAPPAARSGELRDQQHPAQPA